MNITYELEKKDFLALAKYTARTNKEIQKQLRNASIFFAILSPVGILYLDILGYGRLRMGIVVAAIITAVIAYFICSNMFKKSYIDKFVRVNLENRKTLTPKIEMTVDEDTIISGNEMSSGRISLKAIHMVEEDEKYIFFSILASNTMIIPKRAFADEGKVRDFIQMIKAKSAVV